MSTRYVVTYEPVLFDITPRIASYDVVDTFTREVVAQFRRPLANGTGRPAFDAAVALARSLNGA